MIPAYVHRTEYKCVNNKAKSFKIISPAFLYSVPFDIQNLFVLSSTDKNGWLCSSSSLQKCFRQSGVPLGLRYWWQDDTGWHFPFTVTMHFFNLYREIKNVRS